MSFMQDKDRERVRERLSELRHAVTLVNFTQDVECMFCQETRQLVGEVAELSDKLRFEVYDFQADRDKAVEMGVDKIPATVILGEKDHGIRYYGIPSGYEFAGFLDDILMVSNRDSGLNPASRELLAEVSKPIHLEVFATPT
ncbi:MAG: hypothetical protein JSV80_15775 [Acidobacteriota bacterium]|nr:MAG: hypothetical protein JSV80_15775 [Acidobacteriota bacterium]